MIERGTTPDPPGLPVISSSTHPDQMMWYSDSTVTLSWLEPTDDSGILGYSYSFDTDQISMPPMNIMTTNTSITFINTTDGIWYFHLRAVDTASTPNWGPTATYKIMIDSSPPTIPELEPIPKYTAGTERQLNWSAVTDEGVGGIEYLLEAASDESFTAPLASSGWQTVTQYTFTNLTDGVQYWYRVRARDALGHESGFGQILSSMQDSAPPTMIAVYSSTHPSPASVYNNQYPKFNWPIPQDVSEIAGYSTLIDQQIVSVPDTQIDVHENSSMTLLTPLEDGQWYFHARAVDGVGHWSSSLHFPFTIDTTPPTIVPDSTQFITEHDGTPARFSVQVNDEYGVDSVELYWRWKLNSGNDFVHSTLIPDVSEGNNYSTLLPLVEGENEIVYYLMASDIAEPHPNSLHWPIEDDEYATLKLTDTLPPTIERDGSVPSISTGENLHFEVTVSDNVGVSDVSIHWNYIEESTLVTQRMDGPYPAAGTYWLDLHIPSTASSDIGYYFTVSDISQQQLTTRYPDQGLKFIEIIDDERPTIDINSINVTLDSSGVIEIKANCADNIGLKSVMLYWRVAGNNNGQSMDYQELGLMGPYPLSGTYSATSEVKEILGAEAFNNAANTIVIEYYLQAIDTSRLENTARQPIIGTLHVVSEQQDKDGSSSGSGSSSEGDGESADKEPASIAVNMNSGVVPLSIILIILVVSLAVFQVLIIFRLRRRSRKEK